MGAGYGQIVGPAGQCRRQPQNLADLIRGDLHVDTVPLVFRGAVGPAVADAVALGERAVQEDEVRVVTTQVHECDEPVGSYVNYVPAAIGRASSYLFR